MKRRNKAMLPVVMASHYSRFFHLDPCAIGSMLQESFPSYLDRLSARHAVPLEPFLRKIICAGWRGFDPRSHARKLLIGDQDADPIINFVAAETTINTLHDLFPSFLREYGSQKLDLRGTAAWCPHCLVEWQEKSLPVYRPLLWSFSAVKYCPVHWVEIMTLCPGCRRQLDYLGKRHWNGFCPFCDASLAGASSEPIPSCRPPDFERSCAVRISELFTSDGALSKCQGLPIFRKNLEVVLKFTGVNAFCEKTKFSKNNLQAWRKTGRRPQLASFLRLSFCFDVPLRSWVSKQITSSDLINGGQAFVGASR